LGAARIKIEEERRHNSLLITLLSVGTVFTDGDKGKAADMVLTGGVIYMVDDSGTIAEAVAIKNGRITFVGRAADAEKFIGPGTEVINLEGKMVLPGMIETHLHPPGTTLTDLYNISLFNVMNNLDSTMAAIKQFVQENPDLDMYFGAGFSTSAFGGQEAALGPKKERLDEICPDKRMYLRSHDGHIMWLNSKAFELAGVTKDTPDPVGGRIERDPDTGEPWGTIKEALGYFVPEQDFTLEQRVEAMELFQDKMHSWGYTGLFDASCFEGMAEAYKALADTGQLNLRIRAALPIRPEKDVASQVEELKNSGTPIIATSSSLRPPSSSPTVLLRQLPPTC